MGYGWFCMRGGRGGRRIRRGGFGEGWLRVRAGQEGDPSSRKALLRMTAEGGLALRVNLAVVLGESAQSPKQQQEQDNGEAGVRELRTGNTSAEWKPDRGNVQYR